MSLRIYHNDLFVSALGAAAVVTLSFAAASLAYDIGHSAGVQVGWEKGKLEGLIEGFEGGNKTGIDVGQYQGWQDGFEAGREHSARGFYEAHARLNDLPVLVSPPKIAKR